MTNIPPEPGPARRVEPGQIPDYAEFETVVFDRLKLAARGHITRQALLDQAVVTTVTDLLSDSLLVNLETAVLGDDRRTIEWKLTDEYPSSWWQLFKRQHFPRWALDRWPCRYRPVERVLALPLRTLYPEAPVPPGMGPAVFHSMTPPAGFKMGSQK